MPLGPDDDAGEELAIRGAPPRNPPPPPPVRGRLCTDSGRVEHNPAGYHLVRHEERVLNFTEPGTYVVSE